MNPSFLLVLIFFSIGEFTSNEEIASPSSPTNSLQLINIGPVSKKDMKAHFRENRIEEIETDRFLICANAMNVKRHRYKYRHTIFHSTSSLLRQTRKVIYVYANSMSDYLFTLHFDNVFKILSRPFFEVKKIQVLFNATAVFIEMLQQSTTDSYLMYYAVLGKMSSSTFRTNFKNFFALALLLHLVENSSTERLIELHDFFRVLCEDKAFDCNLGKLIKCVYESATGGDPNIPNVLFNPAMYNIPTTAILYQTYFRSRCYNAKVRISELTTDGSDNTLNCAFRLVGKMWEQIANNKCMQRTLSVIYQIEFYNRIRKITQELQHFIEFVTVDAVIDKSFKPLVLLIDDFKSISSLAVTRFLCRQNLTVFNEFTLLLMKIVDTVENINTLNDVYKCAIKYMKFYRYQLFTFCYDMLSEMLRCKNDDDRKRITSESRQVLESFTFLTTINEMICKLKEIIDEKVQNDIRLSNNNEKKSQCNGTRDNNMSQYIACNNSGMPLDNLHQNIGTVHYGSTSIGESFENGNHSDCFTQVQPLPSFSSFVQDICSSVSFSADESQICTDNANSYHSFEFSLLTNDCILPDGSDSSKSISHSDNTIVNNSSNPAFINLSALDNFNAFSKLTTENIQLAFNSIFTCPVIQNEFKLFTDRFQQIHINQPFLQQFSSFSSIYKLIRDLDEVYGLPVARNDNLLAYFKVIANVDTQLSRILMEMLGNERNYTNKHRLSSVQSRDGTGKKRGRKGRRKNSDKNKDLQVDEMEVRKFCERLTGFFFYQVIDPCDP